MIEAVPEATPRNRRYVNELDQIDPTADGTCHGDQRRGAGACKHADLNPGRAQTHLISAAERSSSACAAISRDGCASESVLTGEHRG